MHGMDHSTTPFIFHITLKILRCSKLNENIKSYNYTYKEMHTLYDINSFD